MKSRAWAVFSLALFVIIASGICEFQHLPCAPDHYPKYFEFSVPEDTVSRSIVVSALGAVDRS